MEIINLWSSPWNSIYHANLASVKTCQYFFNKKETKPIEEELDDLIKKEVIKN